MDMSANEISSSSYISTDHNTPPAPAGHRDEEGSSGPAPELLSLNALSSSLEKLTVSTEEYGCYSDAEIEVEGISVGVNRCILAVRSPFFHERFKNGERRELGEGGGKPKYGMSELVENGQVGYEAFMVVRNYLYTGKMKPSSSPREVSTCVDESCPHEACGPAINYAVEMMYASATFQINELVMLVQRKLQNCVTEALAEDIIPILMVACHCKLSELRSDCIHRVAQSNLDDIIIDKELPTNVSDEIKVIRNKSKREEEQDTDSINYRNIRRIHQALDSNDIELVDLLMKESNISLDAAYALHYAAAYCNSKTLKKVLTLGNVDVNLKNPRGNTVLHIAARRKDPSVIVELLDQGASVLVPTQDGRTALTISRRLTRPKDFHAMVKQGEETNKDWLCIDVLEREMVKQGEEMDKDCLCINVVETEMVSSLMFGNMSMNTMMVESDLIMGLLLFENRVAMARSMFPREAKVAMQTADADATSEFAGNIGDIFLKEISAEQVRRLEQRLQALQKTVATGRRFFPNCSEVLDNLSEDDTLGPLMLEKGTPEEQKKKRKRYMELKDDLSKAFDKDKLLEHRLGKTSSSSLSSSSSSAKALHKDKGRKR